METGGEWQGVQSLHPLAVRGATFCKGGIKHITTQKTARAFRSGRFPLLRQAKDHLPI